jgi:hypothetical protein
MGAAVLLCAADWIEQEAQDAAGSLGGATFRGFFYAAVILWALTSWLWLVVHQGLH